MCFLLIIGVGDTHIRKENDDADDGDDADKHGNEAAFVSLFLHDGLIIHQA